MTLLQAGILNKTGDKTLEEIGKSENALALYLLLAAVIILVFVIVAGARFAYNEYKDWKNRRNEIEQEKRDGWKGLIDLVRKIESGLAGVETLSKGHEKALVKHDKRINENEHAIIEMRVDVADLRRHIKKP